MTHILDCGESLHLLFVPLCRSPLEPRLQTCGALTDLPTRWSGPTRQHGERPLVARHVLSVWLRGFFFRCPNSEVMATITIHNAEIRSQNERGGPYIRADAPLNGWGRGRHKARREQATSTSTVCAFHSHEKLFWMLTIYSRCRSLYHASTMEASVGFGREMRSDISQLGSAIAHACAKMELTGHLRRQSPLQVLAVVRKRGLCYYQAILNCYGPFISRLFPAFFSFFLNLSLAMVNQTLPVEMTLSVGFPILDIRLSSRAADHPMR